MNLAEQLALYLHAEGLVDYRPDDVDGDCFVDWLPDAPDEAVAITNTAGPSGDIKHAYSTPGAQLRCRATTALAARSKADAIWSELHGLGEIALPDETWLVSCIADSTPAPMGRDSQNRYEFTVNVLCEVNELTAHRT